MNKTATIAAMFLLAISCTKPADKTPHISPADMGADADYCIDLRSKPKVKLVKKYKNLEPILLNIKEKLYLECEVHIGEDYYFHFLKKFDKDKSWFFTMSSGMMCVHAYGESGTHCSYPEYEISPVTQIDYPESEIIEFTDFDIKHHKKEDLLQFKDKIIDVQISKHFICKPSIDTSVTIVFRARITGECENLPPLRWNIGTTDKDSVIAELIPDETLVIRGNGRMMDFDRSPWQELCWKKEISKVVIEDGVTHIGKHAFYYCDFRSLTIPASVTSKSEYAFNDDFYNAIDIVASFGKSTISRKNISVTIPDSVFYIDEKLLSNFKFHLPSITISNPIPPRLAGDVSRWIRLFNYETLYVPKGSIDAYREAEGWKECKNMEPMK
jgi:hypothetical protein